MGKPDAAQNKSVSEYFIWLIIHPIIMTSTGSSEKYWRYLNEPSFVSKTLPLLDVVKDDMTEQQDSFVIV